MPGRSPGAPRAATDGDRHEARRVVADALARGCDTLVSIGGVQSNHTRQVAAVAARTGLRAVLVQESWVDWPDVVYDRVGNIQLSRLMGADVRLVRSEFGIGVKESWEQALADVRERGGTPYAIPAGASDHRLGGLGARIARATAALIELGRDLRDDEIVLDDRSTPARTASRTRRPSRRSGWRAASRG